MKLPAPLSMLLPGEGHPVRRPQRDEIGEAQHGREYETSKKALRDFPPGEFLWWEVALDSKTVAVDSEESRVGAALGSSPRKTARSAICREAAVSRCGARTAGSITCPRI